MPLPILKTALLLGGAALGAGGAIAEGNSQAASLNAEAAASERRASEEKAAAQRQAIQRRREASVVLSRQQAVAAASGGTATDPTVLDLMGDTAAEGQYQVNTALYEGDTKAAGLLDQASIDRARARQARFAGFINAGSTMLNGLGGMSKSGFGSSGKRPAFFGGAGGANRFKYG